MTNSVIDEFTQLDRDVSDHWVEFWGQNNELSNNYIAGKSNFGPIIQDRLRKIAPSIKNRGIVNVELSNNTFENNPVKLIAILWGEKGQKPIDNTISNSGKVEIVQNLNLKLMY